ncbi:flagellar hook-associated protein FlgL [Shewanella sp.]|uniref:flagellar hook-associated protein FlgL n=1 Tax=Shewanella sp. TaxID=50422 RepID=UPI003A9748FF
MRISTAQIYRQNVGSITRSQQQSQEIIDKLSSGKRVNTAGDDPVAAIGIDNLNQQNALIEQYLKNIDYSKNRLAVTESKLGGAESIATSMRDRILAAANGTLSGDERQGIADELKASLEEMKSIANYQDESGNYLFAGTNIDTRPFDFSNTNTIVYNGNNTVRQAIVADGILMDTNVSGEVAFMAAPNAIGDYSVNYSSTQSGDMTIESAAISDPASYVADTYSFNFTDNGSGGVDLTVTDSSGTTVQTTPNFDPTNPITFNGIEVSFDGTPKAGDSLTIEPNDTNSIFDTVQQAIALFENGEEINTPAGRSKLAQLLNNFDSGVDQIRLARGIAGNNLKAVESYASNHTDTQLVNSSAVSVLEDLDYASAVTEFEKQQLALNAASNLFGRVSSVSLFDYL